MATTISNMNTGATSGSSLDGLLKNVYLPTMLVTAYNDHRFSDMIKQRSDVITGGGSQIVHFASTQRAEGVGAFSEGGNWVNNVPIKGQQLTENVKYLNAYFELTGPVIKAANSGEKSAVNAVTKTVESNIQSFKNYFDRICMGAANGQLGYVSAVSGSTITVTKANFPLSGYNADMFLPVGARVHICTFDSSGIATNGYSNSNSDDDFGFIIDGVNSRVTTPGSDATTLAILDEDGGSYSGAGSQDIAVGDFIIREGSYGTASTSAALFSACLEPNGLSNLVTDGSSNSETASNYTTVWGKTRTDTGYNYLQSYMNNFSGELTEDSLTLMLMDLKYSRQAIPNLLLCTPRAERLYFINNLSPDKRWPGVTTEYSSGYRSTSIQLEDVELKLSSLAAVPAGQLFMLNTNDFAFASNQMFEWVLGDGGQVLVQSHTGDNKFASAVQYMNFVCFDPYRQGKGYSISES